MLFMPPFDAAVFFRLMLMPLTRAACYHAIFFDAACFSTLPLAALPLFYADFFS